MPRYFFDIHDGTRESRDDEGSEFNDLQAACEEAVAVLPALARGSSGSHSDRDIVATVRGADGRALFRTRLSVRSEMLDPGDTDPA